MPLYTCTFPRGKIYLHFPNVKGKLKQENVLFLKTKEGIKQIKSKKYPNVFIMIFMTLLI